MEMKLKSKQLIKIGDLVRRTRRGWLAIVLKVYENNKSADIMWVDLDCTYGENKFDNCSMSLLEVISEAR